MRNLVLFSSSCCPTECILMPTKALWKFLPLWLMLHIAERRAYVLWAVCLVNTRKASGPKLFIEFEDQHKTRANIGIEKLDGGFLHATPAAGRQSDLLLIFNREEMFIYILFKLVCPAMMVEMVKYRSREKENLVGYSTKSVIVKSSFCCCLLSVWFIEILR